MAGDYGQVLDTYGGKFKALGITLLVLGSLSVIFDSVNVALWTAWASAAGYTIALNPAGIYVGVVGIITGGLAIKLSKTATRSLVIAGLVFGSLLGVGSIYMAIVEANGVSFAVAQDQVPQAAMSGLSSVCGFGMFITGAIFLSFSGKSIRLAG